MRVPIAEATMTDGATRAAEMRRYGRELSAALRQRHKIGADTSPGDFLRNSAMTSRGEVYLDLLAPVLSGVGAGWADGTVTVAAEHRASAVALRIIGRLGPQFARRGRKRGVVIIGAPAGDQHSLPGAIVADLLRGEGFEVIDLGANTPDTSFAETTRDVTRLVAVVIGAIASGCDSAVRSTVQAIRRADRAVPVLIGGAAINDAGHARRLGADAWTGPDGRSVITAVNEAARPARPAPRQARTGRQAPAT